MLVHNIEKRKIVLLMPLRTCGGKIIYTRNQELSRPHLKKIKENETDAFKRRTLPWRAHLLG